MNVKTKTNQSYTLEVAPFASGGEGEIYKIKGRSDICVKKFTSFKKERIEKLELIITNRPQHHSTFAWPLEIVYGCNNHAIGYTMPLVTGYFSLGELARYGVGKKFENELAIFSRSTKEGLIKRLVVGLNLAKALYFLQREHKFVITDFKPQNVLFDVKANIMITDIDSIQLKHHTTIYEGGAITPEYAPSETYNSKQFVQSFDSFSFAVILYEIICGIHPFNASFNGQYDALSTIQDKIKHGLFAFGNVEPKVMAKPHKYYSFLPASIKNLFHKAFVSSQFNTAARPTAEEWGRVLFTELKILDPNLIK